MADHKRFSLATDVKVYFCDPHQPWQRGSNENTNGLLRQLVRPRTSRAYRYEAFICALDVSGRLRTSMDGSPGRIRKRS